jgi:hypothetical protein
MAVLIPHRDSRALLRPWSAALFALGCEGAYAFPWMIPLAVLGAPLDREELRRLARSLRELSLAGEHNGIFRALEPEPLSLPENSAVPPLPRGLAFYGPRIDLSPDPEALRAVSDKILFTFPVWILVSALIEAGSVPEGLPRLSLSFRAAAAANMDYRPLEPCPQGLSAAYSFVWETGPPCWLPSVKRQKEGMCP